MTSLRRALLPVLLAGLLVSGCGPLTRSESPISPTSAGPSSSGPTRAGPATLSAVQATLDRLTAAVRADDRSAFDSATVNEPEFAATRVWLFANLRLLDPRTLSLTATAAASPRADSWLQEVTLTWGFAGPDGGPGSDPVTQTTALEFAPGTGGRALLAGIGTPAEPAATPIWLLGPIDLLHPAAGVTLAGADLEPWADAAGSAVVAVRRRVPENRAGLVAEVPAGEVAFERVLGSAPGTHRDLAAIAWPMEAGSSAPVHVVINATRSAPLSRGGRLVLLTHEATHVATDSARSPAPLWLVEGYADQIAYEQVPSLTDTAAAVALDDVERHGPPSGLPSNDRFSPRAADLELTYAQAWLACRYVAEEFGTDRLDALYRAVDGGRTLNAVLPEILGRDRADFLLGWQRYLRRLAAER